MDPKVFDDNTRVTVERQHDICDAGCKVISWPHGLREIKAVSREHTHDLDAIDAYKRNSVLRAKVMDLVWRAVPPPEILSGMRGISILDNGQNQLVAAGGRYLDLKDIHNWKREFKKENPDLRQRDRDAKWEIQLERALNCFENHPGWLREALKCRNSETKPRNKKQEKKEMSHGIVFGLPKRLAKLRRHGSTLTLMDSTHKMCKLQWYLYTLMVRDHTSSWIPCAHLLADGEDSEILSMALKQIQNWCKEVKGEGE
jgi:hypothetical protein